MAPLRFFDGVQWTPQLGPSSGDRHDATMRMLLPVGRTPLSIVAGYVALFSVLLVPAPIALVLGLAAKTQLKRRPGSYGRGRAVFAIVMGSVFTAVLAMVVVAAALTGGT
jgi:hypothetical protein